MCTGCVGEYLEDESGTELDWDQLQDIIREVSQRPAVKAAAEQIAVLYRMRGCSTGGPLHVVVEDTNIEDVHLHPYRPENPWWDLEAYPQADRVLELLRPLSLVERAVATVTHGAGWQAES